MARLTALETLQEKHKAHTSADGRRMLTEIAVVTARSRIAASLATVDDAADLAFATLDAQRNRGLHVLKARMAYDAKTEIADLAAAQGRGTDGAKIPEPKVEAAPTAPTANGAASAPTA